MLKKHLKPGDEVAVAGTIPCWGKILTVPPGHHKIEVEIQNPDGTRKQIFVVNKKILDFWEPFHRKQQEKQLAIQRHRAHQIQEAKDLAQDFFGFDLWPLPSNEKPGGIIFSPQDARKILKALKGE